MNKKGQQFLIGLGISLIGLIFIIGVFPLLKDVVVDARAVENMDCTNTSISSGSKATCIGIDYAPFGWGIASIGVAISMIGIWAMKPKKK